MDRFLGLIKLFVVAAGIAIVVATAALIWLLVSRGQEGEAGRLEAAVPTEPAAEVRASLGVPAGSVVIEMQLDGNQALLLLRSLEGEEFLALVDARTGARRSLLRLVPETP